MKTYQKPTITDIQLEDASVAKMQTLYVVARDARVAPAQGQTAPCSVPCASTDNPQGLSPSPIAGCDGNTSLYPNPTIVTSVIAGGDADQIDLLTNKGWSFEQLPYDPQTGCPACET